jgi:hypothetical protein
MKTKETRLGLFPQTLDFVFLAVLTLLFSAAPAGAHWPNTNATKFVQMPDFTTNGIDVNASGPLWLADDFRCTNTGPITDIHLWCSWLNDVEDPTTMFILSIWSDVPASANNPFSHPGTMLWSMPFAPAQYEMLPVLSSEERFLYPGQGFMGYDHTLWQYNFYPDPAGQFVQTGSITAPVVYWLSVNAQPQAASLWGWKTSTNHFNDYAVFSPTGPAGPWQKISSPGVTWNLDLAFALTTANAATNPPPPPPPPETNTVKFVQPPDTTAAGLDVKATKPLILADDFACTDTGPITDIHFWCSWLNDALNTNTAITLGIWSDVPVSPNNNYSHPGSLLWSQDFAPGQYGIYYWTNGPERFYDPMSGQVLGPDTQMLYYSFYPTNPFVQKGSTTQPTIYWLSVQAVVNGTNLFGWKTAATHFQDVAVWGQWVNGGLLGPWEMLIDATGLARDLAFKITTVTNQCPPPTLNCTNLTVECGSLWPAPFAWDNCCNSSLVPTWVGSQTNGTCPWLITENWSATDCRGQTTTCTRLVTVVDTTPPTITCANNKTVPAGSPWSFDPPTARDVCCGTNLTITILSTATNNPCPLTITRTWAAIDCCTNSASCSQTVTVVNTNTPPADTNWVKYVQWPKLTNGYDVSAGGGIFLADDFRCTNTGPVTDIHLWCSYLKDVVGNPPIWLGIWSDVPAVAGGISHPGQLLWQQTFTPDKYQRYFWGCGDELWYDPAAQQILGPDSQVLYYVFYPTNAFLQQGTAQRPTNYWLSVHCLDSSMFGWKTSTNSYNDAAVWAPWPPVANNNWTAMKDPRSQAPLHMAFKLTTTTTPPPPPVSTKFLQGPDRSTNGYDVLAVAPLVLADDFKCILPKPIRGVTVWGSWLNDIADPNAKFILEFWTDVPATANQPSHPGRLLCSNLFYPPSFNGGSAPLRYISKLEAANLQETFLNPDLPYPQSLIGKDTQLWRYQFFPQLPCWRQYGLPNKPQTYWLSVTALTDPTNKFGWKTSTNHWQDDAVYGHLASPWVPLGDWKDLRDPRSSTNRSLDLAFQISTFPILGWNKDTKNTLNVPASMLEIVVAGTSVITWHFDDYMPTPWPNFSVTYDAAGNTVLRWSGKQVLPNQITHIGFMMPALSVNILSMSWYNAAGAWIGTPLQVNQVWLNGGSGTLFLENNLRTTPVTVLSGVAEFYVDPAPLDQMTPSGVREPIATAPLPVSMREIPPGGVLPLYVANVPPQAEYVLFVLNLAGSAGQAQPETVDFLQLALDPAMQPVILDLQVADSAVSITWASTPGRIYRLQHKELADGPATSWVGDGPDVQAMDETATLTVPIGGTQRYYRVMLVP